MSQTLLLRTHGNSPVLQKKWSNSYLQTTEHGKIYLCSLLLLSHCLNFIYIAFLICKCSQIIWLHLWGDFFFFFWLKVFWKKTYRVCTWLEKHVFHGPFDHERNLCYGNNTPGFLKWLDCHLFPFPAVSSSALGPADLPFFQRCLLPNITTLRILELWGHGLGSGPHPALESASGLERWLGG